MPRTDRRTSPYLVAALGVAMLSLGLGWGLMPALAKPPVPEVPGEVVRMDASPAARERRVLREVLATDRAALAELQRQFVAATDDAARAELQGAIEDQKNATRVRLLDVQIEHARERGDRAALTKLEGRRSKLVRQVGEPKLAAPVSADSKAVAR